jgi:hypothetical protein
MVSLSDIRKLQIYAYSEPNLTKQLHGGKSLARDVNDFKIQTAHFPLYTSTQPQSTCPWEVLHTQVYIQSSGSLKTGISVLIKC